MHNEFVRRVLKLNPSLWVEDSIAAPGMFNFYRMKEGRKVALNTPLNRGFIPEFSIITTDNADLPVKLQLGWRTALQRLVQQKVLTKRQVLETWGDVYWGDKRDQFWHENLAGF